MPQGHELFQRGMNYDISESSVGQETSINVSIMSSVFTVFEMDSLLI